MISQIMKSQKNVKKISRNIERNFRFSTFCSKIVHNVESLKSWVVSLSTLCTISAQNVE